MTENQEDIKKMLEDADLCDLHYDEDSYDIYKSQNDWIICEVSAAADPVVGHVLANAVGWTSRLLIKNDALKSIVERLTAENKRLNIALYTHESYDKTVSEMHEENESLRKALEEIASYNAQWLGDPQYTKLIVIARQALGKGDNPNE